MKLDKRKRLDSNVVDIFPNDKQHLRWQNFVPMSAKEIYETASKELFPFIKTLKKK